MMRPSIRRSVCSYSQICTFCRLCRNRNIKFCAQTNTRRSNPRDKSTTHRSLSQCVQNVNTMAQRRSLRELKTYDGLGHNPLDLRRRRHGCWLRVTAPRRKCLSAPTCATANETYEVA